MTINKQLVLTVTSLIGVAITGYFCYRAGRSKNSDKKKFIPAAIAGAATAGCIICNHHLSMKERAELLAGMGILGKVAKDYQEKIEEIVPEKAHEILKSIQKENSDYIEISKAHRIGGSSYFTDHSIDIPEGGNYLFCLKMLGQEHWFRSSLFNIVAAETHMNRNMTLGDDATTDDLVDFLGLDTNKFDGYYWDMDLLYDANDGCWLDLNTEYHDDGEQPYYDLYPIIEPIECGSV